MPPRKPGPQPVPYLQICYICLRTDLPVVPIEEQIEYFYDDFCGYNYTKKRKSTFCEICLDILIKSYHFQKQCKVAIKLLTEWDESDSRVRKPMTDLFNQLVCHNFDSDVYERKTKRNTIKKETKPALVIDKVEEVKIEYVDRNVGTDSHNDTADNLNNVSDSQNEVTDSLNDPSDSHNDKADNLNDMSDSDNDIADSLKDDNVSDDMNDPDYIEITDNIELDSDDEMVDNFKDDIDLNDESVTVIVKNKENNKIINELLKGIKLTRKVKPNVNVRPEIKKETFSTKEQYNKYQEVFDIVWFNNREEVLAEFAQRKFSDYYLNANYRCDVCFTAYKSQKCLDVHMRWHDPSAGDRICQICSMRFVGTRQLCNHRSRCHSGRFTCKMCPLVTYHRGVMELHYKRHKGIKINCKVCGKGFRNISTKLDHERREHGASHVCGACARAFLNIQGLRQHRSRVHKTRSLVEEEGEARCDECDIIFSTIDVYNIHLKNTPIHKDIANLDNWLICSRCGEKFGEKHELLKHRREEHPNIVKSKKKSPVKLTCELCDATGTFSTWLYLHMKRVHPAEPYVSSLSKLKKYLCDQCGKGFLTPSYLADHLNTHTGARPFACSHCHKTFGTLVTLRTHEERHGPPQRECKHCGKQFVTSANLNNHMRSHIKDRRYKCTHCGKGFIHSGALSEHVRGVHLNIRRNRKERNVSVTTNLKKPLKIAEKTKKLQKYYIIS